MAYSRFAPYVSGAMVTSIQGLSRAWPMIDKSTDRPDEVELVTHGHPGKNIDSAVDFS